jgi:hypothetical protein
MVVMTPPYGVNPAVDVSLAAGIVSVAENEPPTFLKPIDIFDAAPDIDKAFFLRAKLGSPRRGKGSRSSLHFSFRQQDNAGVSDLHAIKIIQVAVVGPFDLDFIAEIVGWQVSYIHEGQMSDDIGLVLHDVNAERITLTYARRRILASLIWRRAMQARMTVKAAMKNVATARISLWKVLIVFQKSFKVTKITSGMDITRDLPAELVCAQSTNWPSRRGSSGAWRKKKGKATLIPDIPDRLPRDPAAPASPKIPVPAAAGPPAVAAGAPAVARGYLT